MLVGSSSSVHDVRQDSRSHILVRIHFHNTKDCVGLCPSTCLAEVDDENDAVGALVDAAAAAACEAFDTASASLLVVRQVKLGYCLQSNHWEPC